MNLPDRQQPDRNILPNASPRWSFEPVVAGAVVVGLGLWLLERGKEPTQLIWVGVALIAGPWLPLTLYRLALVRSPEMRAVHALGAILAPAFERFGLPTVFGAVEQAIAQLHEGGRHDGRR